MAVPFPPGIAADHLVMLPLDEYGIENLHLTVVFRVTDVY